MKINEIKIKVSDLCKNYTDDGDSGVYAYDGKLTVRPAYQREFIYDDKQRDEVIKSIRSGYPLNVMYWSKIDDDKYEVLDGQQRTISICSYIDIDKMKGKGYSIDHRYYHNLTDDEQKQIMNYELTVYVCEGTEAEKLAWFKVINIAGAVLTNQEMLNATYTGPWLANAKTYFSKRNCVAGKMADKYIKGNPIRQEYLEKVLGWIADRDGLENGQEYMALHQHDTDANDLWVYFQTVINWAKTMFPNSRKGITDCQEWGILYNKYHLNTYNTNDLENDIQRLLMDDDVTKQSGIIPYVLSEKKVHDEKLLSIRAFSEQQKRRVYEKQKHKCPFCVKNGNDMEYKFEEMQGDHITPWSKGGHTVESNLQMLCSHCNNDKSNQ